MLPEQDYDVYPTGVSSSGVPAPVPPFESNVSSVSLVSETPDDCETLRDQKAEYQIQGEKRQDVQCDPLPEVEKDKKRGRKKRQMVQRRSERELLRVRNQKKRLKL